jgi:hypothetical protein
VNPDVLQAIDSLQAQGILPAEKARLFSRVARREVVSVRQELRLLLYSGVVVTMAGVGLLVKDKLDQIGPVTIAAGLGVAALGSLVWVARHAPLFSWREAPSPHLAFDYIVLLGVLLTGATVAYVEAKFTPLGAAWAWHLLIMSAFTAALAFRYDSRLVFSLALSTFAAWRGVSVALLEHSLWSWSGPEGSLRANAIGCGVLFILMGVALARSNRKPHFEPVATYLGWILVLGAFLSGLDGAKETEFALCLFLIGAALAAFAFRYRRFPLFAIGVVGSYIGASHVFLRATFGETLPAMFWFLVTSIGLLVGLFAAHRKMKGIE